jgi:protein gp37
MGDGTAITWSEATWNPTLGCSRVSEGCDRCYAIRESVRHLHLPAYDGVLSEDRKDWSGKLNLLPERLDQPLRWTRPRRIFVDSMSDLFHADVPVEFLLQVFDVMRRADRHQFQVLTKRPQRMRALLNERDATPDEVDSGCELGIWPGIWDRVSSGVPLPNVWLGTSIESDPYAFRAEHLRRTPAAVRFLSLEPLLGRLPRLDLTLVDWVIVGAESGPGARPMDEDWVRELRDRAKEAGAAFFYKQKLDGRGRKVHDPELDGRTWTEYPEAAA